VFFVHFVVWGFSETLGSGGSRALSLLLGRCDVMKPDFFAVIVALGMASTSGLWGKEEPSETRIFVAAITNAPPGRPVPGLTNAFPTNRFATNVPPFRTNVPPFSTNPFARTNLPPGRGLPPGRPFQPVPPSPVQPGEPPPPVSPPGQPVPPPEPVRPSEPVPPPTPPPTLPPPVVPPPGPPPARPAAPPTR
jgi:hypothetical protein